MGRNLERLTIDRGHPARETIARAVEVLRAGGIVAFPTDTVFGLAAPATDEGARALAEVKGRMGDKRFLIALLDVPRLGQWIEPVAPHVQKAISILWPQKVSLLLPAGPAVGQELRDPRDRVGLRRAADATTRAMAAALDGAVISTSANLTGAPPASSADGVAGELLGRIDLILDGGALPSGALPTTVVDLVAAPPRIVRRGACSSDRIAELLGYELDH